MENNDLLNNYKDITLEIIKKLNSDEDISFLLKERENILNKIINSNIDKQDIKKYLEILKIEDYEEKLQNIIKNKMLDIKKDIKKLKQSQVAYEKYSNFSGNAVIFSTKR